MDKSRQIEELFVIVLTLSEISRTLKKLLIVIHSIVKKVVLYI